MSFSPQLFWSNIKAKDGLAKPARFEVILPIPTYINSFVENSLIERILNLPNTVYTEITDAVNDVLGNNPRDPQSKTSNPSLSRYLALQCETAEIPGKSLITEDIKIYGPTFKVPYQTQYGDGGTTSLTFLCTNDFYERKLFDRWIEAIMPTDTNNLRYAKDNETRYMSNIKVVQYDEFIKKIYAVELLDAFPVSVASQQVSWGAEGFHRVTIQFAFQKYRVVYDGDYDIVAAISALFGIKGVNFITKNGQTVADAIGDATSILF